MYKIGLIATLILLLIPGTSSAAEFNAGFVKGLWYSSDAIFADTETRIYVALRNNTANDLSGTVQFMDNGSRIGSAFVKALPGRIVEAWIDWKPAYGDHRITATLTDVKLLAVGQPAQQVDVESTIAEDVLFVDIDTDDDKVGNKDDTDDDNDGRSDEEEATAKTDPLTPDTPSDEEESAEQKNGEETSPEQEAKDAEVTTPDTADTPPAPRQGLERFLSDDGAADPIIKNITNTVTETKDKVDTYRDRRADEFTARKEARDASATYETATTTLGDTATVTTTRVEKEKPKLIPYLISGYKAVIDALYTFLLWIVSFFLGYPAIVEILLLMLIIYLVFKTARRLAARPKDFD